MLVWALDQRRVRRLAVTWAACLMVANCAHTGSVDKSTSHACAGKVFVTNSMSSGANADVPGTVSVIDAKTNTVIATIPVGIGPINPTFAHDGTKLYVSQADGGHIAIIDTRTHNLITQLDAGAPRPSGLAFTPDGKSLIVTLIGETLQTPGHMRSIDLATGALGTKIQVGAQPERIALTPDGKRAYVVNLGSSSTSVVDLEKGQVIATIPHGEYPFNILMSPKGDRAFVGVIKANQIAVIDTATNKVTKTIDIQSPSGMAFTPDRDSIFVTQVYGGKIAMVSAKDGAILRTAEIGEKPSYIRLSPDGAVAYIARPYGTTISVLDTKSLAVKHTIETGKAPTSIAVCSGPL